LLKDACGGPGVSRTRNLSVTSPILYKLDHCAQKQRLLPPIPYGQPDGQGIIIMNISYIDDGCQWAASDP